MRQNAKRDEQEQLIPAEAASRPRRAIQNRIRRARLPPLKTLEGYDFAFLKRISRQKILRVFDCGFVATHRNVVLLGNHGVGKTHLLTALGHIACAKGISVRFTRTIDMINKLSAAQLAGTLAKGLRAYTQPSLLLLDELENLPAVKRGTDLLFQVVAARYETGSIVITTNRAFKDWRAILHFNDSLATALIEPHPDPPVAREGPGASRATPTRKRLTMASASSPSSRHLHMAPRAADGSADAQPSPPAL